MIVGLIDLELGWTNLLTKWDEPPSTIYIIGGLYHVYHQKMVILTDMTIYILMTVKSTKSDLAIEFYC